MRAFMRQMHAFYCDLLDTWRRADVDAVRFMDDRGAQNALLIRPDLWRDIFKPP